MSRDEAVSRLQNGEARFACTADIFLRGAIRELATIYAVKFYEQKGWFSSAFIFRGPVKNVLSIKNYIESKQVAV